MRRYIYSGRTGTLQDSDRPIADDLDLLEKSVREANMSGPLRAIELFAYMGDEGPTSDLRGIYEQPSWEDSRYASALIASYDDPASSAPEICEVASKLAARLGAPFHFANDDQPRWVQRQGEPPARSFPMQWNVRWWTEDGNEGSACGEDVVDAKNLEEAHEAIHRLVDARIEPSARRVECEVRDPVTGEWRWPQLLRRGPIPDQEIVDAARHAFRARGTLSEALRDLRALRPEATALHLLENVAQAFELEVRDIGQVSAWARETISDRELDEDMGPRISAKEVQWNAVHSLRERLEIGEPIAVILSQYCERRRSFSFLEVIRLVEQAVRSDASREERRQERALCQEAVGEWLLRGHRADDEELGNKLAALLAERFPPRREY